MVQLTETQGRCLASNILRLIVLPTEACNFRCVYCFERFRLNRMRPSVVRGLERFLTRRVERGLDRLTLSWFGGEPLLAMDVITQVMRHAQRLRRRSPRLELQADVTTNGYLLDQRRFDQLRQLGITTYQITFDGPREWHDRKRVLAGGGGTFDRVWRNLLAMRDSPAKFQAIVRLHVDRDNQHALPEFIDSYARRFGGDRRFRFFLRQLSCFGGPDDASLPVLGARAGPEVVDRLRQLAAALGVAQLDIGQLGSACYAAHGNSYVIRADGRINKCSLALEEPVNQVGQLRTDGTLDLDRARLMSWLRGVLEQDTAALRCPLRGLTADGSRRSPRESAATETAV